MLLWLLTAVAAAGAAQEAQDSVMGKTLDEVQVVARRKAVKTAGAVTTVRVHGSPYASIGSVADMLVSLPGLRQGASGLEVNSLGKPLIYLDGRELTNTGELAAMQSSDIKTVEIDRAPGAQYPAGTVAVVKITTYKPLTDYLSLGVGNIMTVRRKVTDSPGLSFRTKAGRLSTAVNYTFNTYGALVKETYFREIEHPGDYTFTLTEARRLPVRRQTNSLTWSTDYAINDDNRLGFYYYFSNVRQHGHDCGSDVYNFAEGARALDIDRASRSTANLHSFSVVYDYSRETTSLHVSQDYAMRHSRSALRSIEEAAMTDNRNHTAYDVATTNIDLSTALPWQIDFSAGGKLNYVSSTSDIAMTLNGAPYLNEMEVTECSPQAYVSLSRTFGCFTFEPGVRYEYTHRSISDVEDGVSTDHRSHYSHVYPDIAVRYKNGLWRAFATWSKWADDPTFSQLNSGTVYEDSLTYAASNPSLRKSVTDYVHFGVTWRDVSLSARYSHESAPIEEVYLPAGDSGNTLYNTAINLPAFHSWTVALSYSRAFGPVDCYGELSCRMPHAKVLEGEGYAVRRKGSVDIDANISWKISPRFSCYTAYHLQGRQQWPLGRQRSVQNWSIGLTGKFLKNRLTVALQATDLLHKAHYNNARYAWGDVWWGTRGTSDMRGVSVRLYYAIFNTPVNVRARRGNDDILNRIQ